MTRDMRISRRRALACLACGPLSALAAPCFGQALGRDKRKRVVRATIPFDDPQAPEKIRKSWATMFASHGFIDGDNIEIEVVQPRTLQLDQNPEYDAIVRKVLASRPDAIVVHMVWLPHFARFTQDVPLVFSGLMEPELQGYIHSARRPGRNITGALYPLFELQAKRIALAKEMMPKARRAAVVCSRGGLQPLIEEKIKATAGSLGMEGIALAMDGVEEKGRVTRALREARIDIADFIATAHPDTGPDMLRMGVAGTTGGMDDHGIDGILVSYEAIGIEEVAAELAAKILRGTSVSTLPAQFPQKFEMTINLRTARALGIMVPPSILLRATTVFE
jgi:putative ABC transport system substrate-binding protein